MIFCLFVVVVYECRRNETFSEAAKATETQIDQTQLHWQLIDRCNDSANHIFSCIVTVNNDADAFNFFYKLFNVKFITYKRNHRCMYFFKKKKRRSYAIYVCMWVTLEYSHTHTQTESTNCPALFNIDKVRMPFWLWRGPFSQLLRSICIALCYLYDYLMCRTELSWVWRFAFPNKITHMQHSSAYNQAFQLVSNKVFMCF